MESTHPTSTNTNDTNGNTSEVFGNVPNAAETFGTIPHDTERFGNIRNGSERTDHHTLTVRDVARMFEQADVSRTERSIINWCQPNRQGIARLDAFYDANERKYFITPESTARAIQEEQSKQQSPGVIQPPPSQDVPNTSEDKTRGEESSNEVKTLELKLRDLEITNRAKDYYIEQFKSERESFQEERRKYVERLINSSREIGQLRTQVFLLGSTPHTDANALPNDSETGGAESGSEK